MMDVNSVSGENNTSNSCSIDFYLTGETTLSVGSSSNGILNKLKKSTKPTV